MDVDLDDAGIGRHAETEQAGIAAGRRIALDEHRLAEFLGGVLDRGDEIEIVLGAFRRRHEDEEMAVARLEGHGAAHDAGGGRAVSRLAGEIGRQRPPPRFPARFAVAVGLERGPALLAAQHRGAAEGFERWQVGMRRHRIGLGNELRVCRRRPGQRIERQAVTDRRIARDQVALLRPQEPRPAAPAAAVPVLGLAVVLASMIARDRQHVADGSVETLLEYPCQPLALHRVADLGRVDRDVARQPPLAPQVVPGVLESAEQVIWIELQALREGQRKAMRRLGRGARGL